MIQQLLSDFELAELQAFPFLQKQYQHIIAEGESKGRIVGERDAILEVLEARFDIALRDYRRIEKTLAQITDLEKLNVFLRLAATASTFTIFDMEFAKAGQAHMARQN